MLLGRYRPSPFAFTPFAPRPGQATLASLLVQLIVLTLSAFSLLAVVDFPSRLFPKSVASVFGFPLFQADPDGHPGGALNILLRTLFPSVASPTNMQHTPGREESSAPGAYASSVSSSISSSSSSFSGGGDWPRHGDGDDGSGGAWGLQSLLVSCCAISAAVACMACVRAVKKGTSLGARLVVHPSLCPEPRTF